MKAGLVAIVVLSLTVLSPAYGQDQGSGGTCALNCVPTDSADVSVARSPFHQLAFRSSAVEDPRCTDFIKLMNCVEGCPDKYATLARESRLVAEKYCGADEAAENFFADSEKFQVAWAAEQQKCLNGANTPDAVCKEVRDCVFGSALTSAKNGFGEDIVGVNVNTAKLSIGSSMESNGENLPSSCGQLFEPYQPEPQPPYVPEPYPYEPYEPESYQRKPYQRNPYQRNSYRRNAYRRTSYQRNPYRHRN